MHILIVDDEPNIRTSLRIALESMKHTVDETSGVGDALKRLEQSAFDLAFVDIRLGQDSGLDLLEAFREHHHDWPSSSLPRTPVSTPPSTQ